MVSMGLNYLLLWQEFVIEWNLWQECWIFPFQDYVNDLRDNLCCWFSLHVTSGHCSHLICMCTYHLHIIWAYVYYAHIICTSPSYVLSSMQCDLYVLLDMIPPYYTRHVVCTYTHYLLCIFHIPYIPYYLQLSFRILSPYTHVIRTSSICHLHCYSWSSWAWTIFYCDRNLLLNGICGRNVVFHFRIM